MTKNSQIKRQKFDRLDKKAVFNYVQLVRNQL